jgi:hypothetical protein
MPAAQSRPRHGGALAAAAGSCTASSKAAKAFSAICLLATRLGQVALRGLDVGAVLDAPCRASACCSATSMLGLVRSRLQLARALSHAALRSCAEARAAGDAEREHEETSGTS